MEKIVFYVEGHSEKILIEKLFIGKYSKENLKKDLLEYKNSSENQEICAYCFNCESVDKIPHKINEEFHYILSTHTSRIIIICDIEDLCCNTGRRQRIEAILGEHVKTAKVKIEFVFFNKAIENLYICTENEEIIRKAIEAIYFKKNKKRIEANTKMKCSINNPKGYLNQLMKKNNLKYRETDFAEEFFSRLDFGQSHYPAIQRLCKIIENK